MPTIKTNADQANAVRVQDAVNAIIKVLRLDPRVQQAYSLWRDAGASEAAAQQLVAALGLDSPLLPRYLLGDFTMQPAGLMLDAPIFPSGPDWPRGKANGGQPLIARNVEWWYRTTVKLPRDTVYQIAKERARQNRKPGYEHPPIRTSVVDAGVNRVKQFLATLTL